MSNCDCAVAVRHEYVCLLQNAWSPVYAGGEWPRSSWLPALHDCRSGKTLSKVFPYHVGVWYDNTTREVARHPSGVCSPSESHVRSVLDDVQPRAVLACGKQAGELIVGIWGGPLVIAPHPAYRVVTDALWHLVRSQLRMANPGRVRFVQARGSVKRETIE